MKSVGEVMAIGRTFQESFQKALRGLEVGADGMNQKTVDRETIEKELGEPGPPKVLRRVRVVAQLPDLVRVVHHERQVGRHEGSRVMRLEIGSLVGDERIRRGMRFVEAIAGELFHQVEEMRRLGARYPVCFCTGNENVALFRHLLDVLLAHRAAQQVGATQRVAADRLRDLHHLFLVHHHAVRGRENRLEARVLVVDSIASALSCDVIGDERHRTGPVERDQRNDILEPGRRRLLQQVAHAARFKLEHRGRVAGAEDVVGGLVVERQRVQRQ